MIGDFVKAIPSIYGLLAIGALIVAAAGFGYVKGVQHESDRHADFRAAVETAQAHAEAAARLRAERERQVHADTAAGWSAAVLWHRAHSRIVRVQQPASGCDGEVSGVPAAPSESAARPTEPRLDPEQHAALTVSVAECEQRLNNAVMDAAQVMHLANWIKQQHEASK